MISVRDQKEGPHHPNAKALGKVLIVPERLEVAAAQG
jgi:hypothetical protein